MILLEDNREALYQWDLNQRLILIDIEAGTEVQISDSNNTDEYCLTSKAYNENGNVYAKIPNIYLQKSGILYVYIYVYQEDKSYTKYYTEIIVLPRKKPSNYIYTETEKYTVSEMLKDALEEAKASGEFKGEKGEPGQDAPQEAVLYTPQTLTDAQKAQARENIAAAGVARVEAVETALAGKLDNVPDTWPEWSAIEQAAARERMGLDNWIMLADLALDEEVSTIIIPNSKKIKELSIFGTIYASSDAFSGNVGIYCGDYLIHCLNSVPKSGANRFNAITRYAGGFYSGQVTTFDINSWSYSHVHTFTYRSELQDIASADLRLYQLNNKKIGIGTNFKIWIREA